MKLDDLRRLSQEWCEFAINRGVADPVYKWATEGRDNGPGYSSCGDLAHWLLYRLGCREPWVNREEAGNYRAGWNITLLASKAAKGGNPIALPSKSLGAVKTGDIVLQWTKDDTSDAHVMVVDTIRDGYLWTFDFGQGPMDKSSWKRSTRYIEGAYRKRLASSVPVKSILYLEHVPFTAEPDLPSGERFDQLEGLA